MYPADDDSAPQARLSKLCCDWHLIEQRGIALVIRNGRVFASGPAGTEGLVRELLRDRDRAQHLASTGCTCSADGSATASPKLAILGGSYDEPYSFAQRLPTLVNPGPFTRDEYAALRSLRARILVASRSDDQAYS